MLRRWGLRKEFGAAYGRYELRTAEILCLAWCHRMAHFARLWVAQDLDDNFEFTHLHVTTYKESHELVNAVSSWPAGSPAYGRLGELRAIMPIGRGMDIRNRPRRVKRKSVNASCVPPRHPEGFRIRRLAALSHRDRHRGTFESV